MLLVFTEDIGLVVGDGHVTWSQSPSNTDKQEAGFPYHPFHNRLTNLGCKKVSDILLHLIRSKIPE